VLREWRLNLKLNLKHRPGGAPVYVQIAHGLVAEIRRGRLIAGEVLPGSREMAEELGVNRKTVVVAYDELIAQGWLTTGVQAGNLIGGSIVVETVFGWPGIGTLAFNALQSRDLNLLLAIFFMSACLIVIINLVVDVIYVMLDPRIEI
jgi:ABC-type proline/glycine betaine transport system permease subunit